MKRNFLLILICCILTIHSKGQVSGGDSVLVNRDPVKHQNRVLRNQFGTDTIDIGKWLPNKSGDLLIQELLNRHPYYGFKTEPQRQQAAELRNVNGKEWLFYLLVFLWLVFALLRRAFLKYFQDLFRLLFVVSSKQKQIREQLIQTPFPSIALNLLFVITGGLYIAFLLDRYKVYAHEDFWLLTLYSSLGLAIIYFVKFVGLKLSGWLFNMRDASGSYIFIVFIINKMLGILLLVFLGLLAFTGGKIYSILLVLSWCLAGSLYMYRFAWTLTAVRNEVKVNLFHFFIYLCAFEIAPLLLVYKALLLFFSISP